MNIEYTDSKIVSGRDLMNFSTYVGRCVRYTRCTPLGYNDNFYIITHTNLVNLLTGDSMLINPNEIYTIVNAKIVVE